MFNLAGYAGWNTSSNTLGTAICQATLYNVYGKTDTHTRFIAERIFEDVGYCGYVRKYMCDNVLPGWDLNYFNAGDFKGKVSERVAQEISKYIRTKLPSVCDRYEIVECEMPWRRMFEVGIRVKEK